ncbi:hypothetical protein [Chitinophaga flava]|uniref:Uncharacterized protein n=1 Tax=Chitinophaga flava TaxID=2259036 RepID=A0A365XW10_9BACT|nr:hypothetical protein [Chitinophaga flava]RBL90552.1 hypothetical protein DF182_29285 [Chitinophaga flava]
MYFILAILTCIIGYVIYKACTVSSSAPPEQQYTPPEGEDAAAQIMITGIVNSSFSISRYLRNLRNTSADRFITVAIRQVISTQVGTTTRTRLIENLGPGDECCLGHADHVMEGQNQIYIGYEVLWARYVAAPANYKPHRHIPSTPPYNATTLEFKPGTMPPNHLMNGRINDLNGGLNPGMLYQIATMMFNDGADAPDERK